MRLCVGVYGRTSLISLLLFFLPCFVPYIDDLRDWRQVAVQLLFCQLFKTAYIILSSLLFIFKHSHTKAHTDPYIHIYEVLTISFHTFLYKHLKLSYEKFSMLLLYILCDDWPVFMISRSNEKLQQQLEYTLLYPDCHSWRISKMQSGREDTLEERYAIKFCFKHGKISETYGMLQSAFRSSCINRAWVFEWHKKFKQGRESVRNDERCGRSKGVNTLELIGQRLRVRVTMLRF